ncbi:FecR domain-containing protein [Ferrovibrio sp.]|uniref:FecR domain-containing protein n=1 Tax=Ferrovibrio sp. TaxID=1917215 RepID=UPI0035AE6EC1
MQIFRAQVDRKSSAASQPRSLMRHLALAALPAFALLHPALAPAPALAAGESIGVAAAVNPDATGQPPAMDKRIIEVGTNMLVDEKVVTGPNGQAQLIFRDGSAFSIGPNSELTLDKFVYDPAKGSGEIALSVTKGVFRFVGGKISKDNPVQIKAGSATMGIRGGIATLNINPGQPVVARFLFGREMSMTQNGVTQVTTRPGTAIDVLPGAPPSPPRTVSAQEMRESSSQLESSGGGQQQQQQGGGQQGGGQQGGPPPGGAIESRLDSSGVSNSNSAPPPAGIAPVGPPPPPAQRAANPPAGLNPQTQSATQSANQSVSNNQASTSNQAAQNTVSTPTFSQQLGRLGRFIFGNGSTAEPYTGFNAGTLSVSINDEYSQTPSQYAGLSNGAQWRVTVDGTSLVPETTTLTLPSQSGFFSLSSITNPYGTFSGIGYASPARDFYFYGLQSGADTKMLLTAGVPTTPTNFTKTGLAAYTMLGGLNAIPLIGEVVPNADTALRNSAVYSPLYAAYNAHLTPTEIAGSDQRSVLLQASIGISGQGASQTSFLAGTTGQFGVDGQSGEVVALGGVAGSYMRSGSGNNATALRGDLSTLAVNGDHSAAFGSSGQYLVLSTDKLTPNTGTNSYDRTSQLGIATPQEATAPYDVAFVDVAVRSTTTPSIVTATPRSSQTLQGYASGMIQRMDANNIPFPNDRLLQAQGIGAMGLTVITDATTNRAQATMNLEGDSNPYSLEFGGVTGALDARSAFVNDKLYALRESATTNSTADSDPVTNQTSLMVSSSVANVDAGFLPNGVNFCSDCDGVTWGWWFSNFKESDGTGNNIHLGTYMTGLLPSLPSIPQTGTARFGGHAIGNVQNTGNRYIAVGNFDASWNFGSRVGMFKISDFDSLSLYGNGNSANGRDFYGSLSGSSMSGGFEGSFFEGGGNAARYMGGQFDISGPDYTAGGTFVAGSNASAAVNDLYAQGWRGHYYRYNLDTDTPSKSQYPYSGFNNMNLGITPTALYNSPVSGVSRIGNSWFRITTAAGDFFFNSQTNSSPTSVGYSNTYSPFDDYTTSTTQEGTLYYPNSGIFFFASLADSTNPNNSRTVVYAGQPTTMAQFPTTGMAAHNLLFPGTALPFVPGQYASQMLTLAANTEISPIYSVYNPNITGAGLSSSPQRSVFLQASIGIYGQGSSQQSLLVGSTGIYSQEGSQQSVMLTGGVRGSVRDDANDTTVRVAGGVASASTGTGNAIYGSNADHIVLAPDNSSYNSSTQTTNRIDQAGFLQPHDQLSGEDYYYNIVANRQATLPATLTDPTRTTRTLHGYAAAMVEGRTSANVALPQDYALTSAASAGGFTLTTNATTNRADAIMVLTGSGQNYGLHFGSQGSESGSSAFINDEVFGLRETTSTSSQVNGVDVTARSLMVTHALGTVSNSALGSVTLCSCEYLQWGWWITDITHNGAGSATPGQRDRVHMASWVAGDLPGLAEIPVTGTASFSGHATANVNNNGSRYVAFGSFSQSWNFATQAGNVTISNFDGIAPITGAVTAGNGRDFSGTLSATGGYTGSLNGSFFKGGGDPTKSSGGNFSLNNTSYSAAGTFAAQKLPP